MNCVMFYLKYLCLLTYYTLCGKSFRTMSLNQNLELKIKKNKKENKEKQCSLNLHKHQLINLRPSNNSQIQIYNKILTCTQVQQLVPGEAEAGWRGTGVEYYHHPPGEAAGKPGSVGPDPFTTQEAGNTDSLWNLPGFLLNVLVLQQKLSFFHVVCFANVFS